MSIERKINVDNGGGSGSFSLSGNALEGEVLIGKTFYSNSKTKKTGTMPNRGAVTVAISPGQTYNITSGYHDGNGTVTATLVTPADFTGSGNSSSLTVSGLTQGNWYAFAVFNGRNTYSVSYSSGLTHQRTTGGTTSVMDVDGSSSTTGYLLCCIGETTGTSVSFSCRYSSNIRIRWLNLGTFQGSGSVVETYSGATEFTPNDLEQSVACAGMIMPSDITINPVPNTYGHIASQIVWTGTILTIS